MTQVGVQIDNRFHLMINIIIRGGNSHVHEDPQADGQGSHQAISIQHDIGGCPTYKPTSPMGSVNNQH